MPQVGALQAPDIIREELAQAAQSASQERDPDPGRHISLKIKRLSDWAAGRRKNPTQSDSASASSGSPESVSSTEIGTPSLGKTFKRITPKLALKRVSRASASFRRSGWQGPARKKTIIAQSTIPDAGEGLFLIEDAKGPSKSQRIQR